MGALHDPSNCDHEAARLLPWLVAGTLGEPEKLRVQEHLRNCLVCAADWQREQQIQSLLGDEPTVEHAPQPGLQKLMSRIDELERELPVAHAVPILVRPRALRRMNGMRWLAAAAIVQTVGLGILGVLLWQRGVEMRAPRFHTLTSAAATGYGEGQIRVVFAPGLAVGEMQQLLRAVSATVVSGPSAAGVYTLALRGTSSEVEPALAALRANAGVMFAEPQLVEERGE